VTRDCRASRRSSKVGDDSERQACHYQCVTTLRELLGRWGGTTRPKESEYQRIAADPEARANKSACSQAKSEWRSLRGRQRLERYHRRLERKSGMMIRYPVTEEMELARLVTARNRRLREGAAASLHGRNLSPEAAQALVWQLRHHNPAYRKAAMDALWSSTITDSVAARVLAQQVEHRKPELREVARQVLQHTNINTDDEVMEYLDSARRRGLGDSDN
jgi:hypothetical protein